MAAANADRRTTLFIGSGDRICLAANGGGLVDYLLQAPMHDACGTPSDFGFGQRRETRALARTLLCCALAERFRSVLTVHQPLVKRDGDLK